MNTLRTWMRLVVAIVLALVAFAAWSLFQKHDETEPRVSLYAPGEEVTLAGEIVCLPHKDTSGPQTMECAFGLQADDGLYYGLRDIPQGSLVDTGRRIEVTGVWQEADASNKYDVQGVVAVTSVGGDDTATGSQDEGAVLNLVIEFGMHLKNVSLTAAPEIVADALRTEYSPFVTEELLNVWVANPAAAPGRQTSSPWPEAIEVSSIESTSDGYVLWGEVILMTSSEVAAGVGDAGREQVEIRVSKERGMWQISGYTPKRE